MNNVAVQVELFLQRDHGCGGKKPCDREGGEKGEVGGTEHVKYYILNTVRRLTSPLDFDIFFIV